ncbi:MAG: hypothetical protein ABSG59_02480 [Verrucomicrobiota bacterium]|jgi:hypothetical protein
MKRASRILIAVFAVLAAIAWCLVPVGIAWLGWAFHGMSDGGAGEQPVPLPLHTLLLLVGIWLVPMTAFVLMFLSAINVLKGAMRCVAYWYALVFLIVAAAGLTVYVSSLWSGGNGYKPLRLIALAFILAAGLWGFGFRGSPPEKARTP